MASEAYLKEGTITEFSGVSFDPFSYLEGKRILCLLTQKIRGNKSFIKELLIHARLGKAFDKGMGIKSNAAHWSCSWIVGRLISFPVLECVWFMMLNIASLRVHGTVAERLCVCRSTQTGRFYLIACLGRAIRKIQTWIVPLRFFYWMLRLRAA